MNIIKITPETYYNVEDFTEEIIFIYEGAIYGDSEREELEERFENLLSINGKEWNSEEVLKDFLREYDNLTIADALEIYNDWFGGYDITDELDKEDLENEFQDQLHYNTQGYFEGLFNGLEIPEEEGWELVLENLGLQIGTVGRSGWSVFIAPKDMERNFISDLYQGFNIYHLELMDENGTFKDSVGAVYAPLEEDLDDAIRGYLVPDNEEYYIVDNEYTQYVSLPKVKEVEHVEYEYEVI